VKRHGLPRKFEDIAAAPHGFALERPCRCYQHAGPGMSATVTDMGITMIGITIAGIDGSASDPLSAFSTA
jgi:hypothetical protein